VSPYSVKDSSLTSTISPKIEVPEAWINDQCNSVEELLSCSGGHECYNIKRDHVLNPKEEKSKVNEDDIDLDLKAEFEENSPTFDEPMTQVQLGCQLDQYTRVGKTISWLLRNEIECVIIVYVDLFIWSPTDMPSIDPDFMCHKLVILPQAKSVT